MMTTATRQEDPRTPPPLPPPLHRSRHRRRLTVLLLQHTYTHLRLLHFHLRSPCECHRMVQPPHISQRFLWHLRRVPSIRRAQTPVSGLWSSTSRRWLPAVFVSCALDCDVSCACRLPLYCDAYGNTTKFYAPCGLILVPC